MYGKPQPVRFTRSLNCQDCSNQFREPRVQSVLDYPPPPSAPLFCLVSKEPCMESPNQYLSPDACIARIAQTSFEIQGSKVCSTIRPLPLRHCLLGLQGTMYGKPQPVPFTRSLNCRDCSNQFREPRVQSVLDYPPPPSAPLFWLVSKEPCMESPNQYLSSEPSFARIAPTSVEIQGSKVCWTIRPLPLHHYFGWFQRNHVWKAPTSTFHQKLELPGLLQPVSRSKGPKCARLSAPSLCATVLLGLKGTMYGKPQPVPFTRSLHCQDCSNQFRDPRVQSVLDYPPPPSASLFCLVSKEPCMERPNQYLSPEA